MAIKLFCSYCGIESVSAKPKVLAKWCEPRKLKIKWPVCGRCFLLIKSRKLPIGVTPSESGVASKIKEIEIMAHSISKKTPLHEVNKLMISIDSLSIFHHEAVKDFNDKAEAASDAAKKVEWSRNIVESAKNVVESKLEISYDFCRKMANKAISNPELRKSVFERDGFACKICKSTENLSVDHVRPVRFGGGDEFENFQTLCLSCNCRKGSKI